MNEPRPTSLEALKALELPPAQFMVMGSGVMEALHIRPANDIDLVVDDALYAQLAEQGWQPEVASNGANRLAHDTFQVYDRWYDQDRMKKLPELIQDAQWIDGVAFNSLRKLILYKHQRGADKDLADLELINKFLEV